MDVLVNIILKWMRRVVMSMETEDARDWNDEPMVECKCCGEPVLINDRDEWGYCKKCTTNEDDERE